VGDRDAVVPAAGRRKPAIGLREVDDPGAGADEFVVAADREPATSAGDRPNAVRLASMNCRPTDTGSPARGPVNQPPSLWMAHAHGRSRWVSIDPVILSYSHRCAR
jgi:hypothetical protein